MILKHRLLEKYSKYKFKIPIGSQDTVLVKPGKNIKKGDQLYIKRGSNIKHSFYLPEEIGCTISDAISCVTSIDGEFVDKGEILAEKFATAGLTIKRLVSPAIGLVDLSRIKLGYLDILGEDQESLVLSSFDALILDVNHMDGILVESDVLALDMLCTANNNFTQITGEFEVLNVGKDVKLRAKGESYDGKIVFVGKYLHKDLLQDLFVKGAKFVLTYAMNYEDFRTQGLPIGIIGGFGETYSPHDILNKFSDLEGSFVVVDNQEKQIFFLNDKQSVSDGSLFVNNLVGMKVISHSLGNYGMLGEVVSIENASFISVEWENGMRSVINIGNVEVVSY